MRWMRVWFGAAALTAAGLASAALPARALTPARQISPDTLLIISPVPGETVSGVLQIVGTALDPAFLRYELDWAPDPPVGDAWQPIQPPIFQQVRSSVLGIWDTTSVPDGQYLIRVRLVRADESSIETQVRVQVVNATATPSPSPAPTATATGLPGTPTAGPSPTPLIQQPPTRTPRPTETPGGPTPTPAPLLAESPFEPARLRQAACSGVYLALAIFGGLAGYGLIRAAVRGQLRAVWWQLQREVLNPLIDTLRRDR